MDAEQLQAAYFKGHGPVYPGPNWAEHMAATHAAGLAEVARQQAEHDAQIAERVGWGHVTALNSNEGAFDPRWEQGAAGAAEHIATTLRAQFGES